MRYRKFSKNRLDLLYELVKTNFKMRYYNSFLGVLWVLIKPYSMFLVLYFLWSGSRLSDANLVKDYAIYLLLGIVMYTFTNEMVTYGQMSLLERAHIILKVNFPRQIAVISAMSNAIVNLLINIVFVFAIFFLRGYTLELSAIPVFLLVVITLFVWCLALALFSSVLTIRFRDLKNIFELGILLMMYATPVFYEATSFLGDKNWAVSFVQANPLGILINNARAALGIYGEVQPLLLTMYLAAGLIALMLGWAYFGRAVKQIAEYI